MRPRFSVRVLLVAVALLAVACYQLLVRPRVMAERFVAAVNKRDFTQAQTLLQHPDPRILNRFFTFSSVQIRSRRIVSIYAEMLPREWRDIAACHRRVIFRVGFRDDRDGRHVEWIEDIRMLARWNGLDVSTWP